MASEGVEEGTRCEKVRCVMGREWPWHVRGTTRVDSGWCEDDSTWRGGAGREN